MMQNHSVDRQKNLRFRLRGDFWRFRRDARGVFAIMFAGMFATFLLMASFVATYWQNIQTQEELQLILDQALAVTAAYYEANRTTAPTVLDTAALNEALAEGRRLFNANSVTPREIKTNITASSFNYSDGSQRLDIKISFEASVKQESLFNVFGVTPEVSIRSTGNVRPAGALEVVMVLDVSGSMAGSVSGVRKIDSMKQAANDLINILLFDLDEDGSNLDGDTGPKRRDTYIAVVPYSTSVRLPEVFSKRWINERTSGFVSDHDYAWSSLRSVPTGLLEQDSVNFRETIAQRRERYGNCPGYRAKDQSARYADFPAAPPPATAGTYITFPPLLPESSDGTRLPVVSGSNWQALPVFPGIPAGSPSQYFGRYCIPEEIVPLTDDATVLRAALDSLVPRGGTMTHQGAIWGLRTLSPRWDWRESPTKGRLPSGFATESSRKYFILLTDGVINIGAPFVSASRRATSRAGTTTAGELAVLDPYTPRRDIRTGAYTSRLPSNHIGSGEPLDYIETVGLTEVPGRGFSNDIVDAADLNIIKDLPETYALLQKTCETLTFYRTTIYTILYDLNDSRVEQAFRNCAGVRGGNGQYFRASSNLRAVFQRIATNIRQISLTLTE